MNLKYRRLLYSAFFLIFLIVAPILALYTAGYSYNFKKNRLEKTGILTLDSQPKKAAIYINGKYKSITPLRLSRLLPNNYQVEVSKEGYYPWVKEVEIKSNLTTFYKNIILFKKNLPTPKIEGNINILNITPDQEKIVYSIINNDAEELRLLNLENNSDFLIENFDLKTYNQLYFIQWSPSQNKALIKQTIGDFNKYLIVDIDTLKIKELFTITKLNFDQIYWDNQSDAYLYALRKEVLYQIDLAKNSTKTILSDYITSLQVNNNEIYYTTKINGDSFLNQKLLEDVKKDKTKKIKLPIASNYLLQPSPAKLLILLDKKNNNLFIINTKVFDTQDIESEVILQAEAKDIFWSKDFKKLIYYTDLELWTYNFTSKQKELVNRYSKVINQATWYPGNNYVIYRTQNSIRATEIQGPGIKNDTTLSKLEGIKNIVVDKEGKNIYFQGKIENIKGIFQLAIQ